MIRVGIVGCGHIGTVHSFALKQLVGAGEIDARVVATFDADPERAQRTAEPHAATACAALDPLLDAVDVAWVCTWTSEHRAAVEAAAARGRAVFCEKPLAPSLAECERVASALCRVPHQVGLVLRYAPVFRAAADAIAERRYGRVLSVTLRDDQYFPIQGMYGSTWRKDVGLAGGGTLIEHSVHDVDVLRWLLGDPREVSARVASRFGYPGIDDACAVTFAYDDGTTATLLSVWHQVLTRGSRRRLEIFCEDAFLWTEDDYLGPLHVETSTGHESIAAEPPPWVARFTLPAVLAKSLAQYAEPAKAFLDALAADGSSAHGHPDAETALAAHRLVDLAYRSAAAGGTPLAAR